MPYPGQTTKFLEITRPKPRTTHFAALVPIALRRSLNLPPAASLQFMAVADVSSGAIGVPVSLNSRREVGERRQHQGHVSWRAPRRGRSSGTRPDDSTWLYLFSAGLPIASIADRYLRPGHIVLAVGNYEGGPLAALGIIAIAGGPGIDARGGTIDERLALISPSAQQPRAAPSSARKDTSSGWRFSDRGAARWRFPA